MRNTPWQKLLLVTALMLLAVALVACGSRAVAAPTAAETPTPAPEEEVAAPAEGTAAGATIVVESGEDEPGAELGFETYLALRPVASGGGTQLLALRLFEDGSVELATDFQNGEPPIVEVGTWQDNGHGTVNVALTGQQDRAYEEPEEITFQRDDDWLIATAYDESVYGSQGLRLRLAQDVMRDVRASLFTIDLQAGFPLDPTFVSVNGGGEIDASLLSSGCAGFVNPQPVVSVNWLGTADFVETFFVSDGDSTLMVLTPDGKILCNDDANRHLLDPVIQIDNPAEGTYKIWVGSHDANQLIPGVLVLTADPEVNIGTFNLGGFIKRALIPEIAPLHETVSEPGAFAQILEQGLADAPEVTPDITPVMVEIVAEGTVPLFQLPLEDKACAGLVTGVPNYLFKWSGEAEALQIFFESDQDSTLLVLGPDKLATCGDDAEAGVNLNPSVAISSPTDGVYAVYVGRLNPEVPVSGVLTITDSIELLDVLAPAGQ